MYSRVICIIPGKARLLSIFYSISRVLYDTRKNKCFSFFFFNFQLVLGAHSAHFALDFNYLLSFNWIKF